jgi:hypothetical protein
MAKLMGAVSQLLVANLPEAAGISSAFENEYLQMSKIVRINLIFHVKGRTWTDSEE